MIIIDSVGLIIIVSKDRSKVVESYRGISKCPFDFTTDSKTFLNNSKSI
jgi:hypothetical protein